MLRRSARVIDVKQLSAAGTGDQLYASTYGTEKCLNASLKTRYNERHCTSDIIHSDDHGNSPSVTHVQKLHWNLRPPSTNTMNGHMYALHLLQRTGPIWPRSTTGNGNCRTSHHASLSQHERHNAHTLVHAAI